MCPAMTRNGYSSLHPIFHTCEELFRDQISRVLFQALSDFLDATEDFCFAIRPDHHVGGERHVAIDLFAVIVRAQSPS